MEIEGGTFVEEMRRMSNSINEEIRRFMLGLRFTERGNGIIAGPLIGKGTAYDVESYRDKLAEKTGVFAYVEKPDKLLVLETDRGEERFCLSKETIVDKEQFLQKGEELTIIGLTLQGAKAPIALCVLRKEETHVLRHITDIIKRLQLAKAYMGMGKERRERIRQIQSLPEYEMYDAQEDAIFTSTEEWYSKYQLTKQNYSPDVQASIELLFKELPNPKSKAKQKLDYLMNINPMCHKRKPIDVEALKEVLDKKLYGMKAAKQMVIDILASNEKAGRRGCVILFVGSAGVGKTSMAECVAQIGNLPYEIIPMNGMASPLELEGIDSDYDTASVGRFIEAFRKHGTSEIVCVLDELDKTCTAKEGDPLNCLYGVLTGKIEDKFLEASISTENTIFIATANSLDYLPEPLLNRFDCIIRIPDYSMEEKLTIAKEYVIPEILENFGQRDTYIRFSEEAITCILKNYCEDAGARDLKHNLTHIVRRIISGVKPEVIVVSPKDVHAILEPLVDTDSYGIRYARERENYSEPVAKEICKCLSVLKSTGREKEISADTAAKKLEYLLPCRHMPESKEEFEPEAFREKLRETHFGMEKVIDEVTIFYYLQSLSGGVTSSNLALYGGKGTGKSSLCKSIAKALGYYLCKISLNGIKDVQEIRGFLSSFKDSEPGLIIKAIKEAGSLKLMIQLDELDKMPHELSYALIDLLDREFRDNFLGIPVDLSQVIFIAACNDWNAVNPIIRDRFVPVEVEGYTGQEKAQIMDKHVIPKLEKAYAAAGVSITMEEDAKQLLLENYCPSFGVRDIEKGMQKLVGNRLCECVGKEDSCAVSVSFADVERILGKKPIPRGNFPEGAPIAGISKALAVSSDNAGNAFAIETVLLPCEEKGGGNLHITGLPKESAVDSVKLAHSYVKRFYPELIKDREVYLHFAEGAVPKDGPSAGVAIVMSVLSAAKGVPIMDEKPYDIAYTGEIDLMGGIYAVGGVMEKIQAADRSGCSRVFIPAQNYQRLDVGRLEEYKCKVIPVNYMSEVIEAVFGDCPRD